MSASRPAFPLVERAVEAAARADAAKILEVVRARLPHHPHSLFTHDPASDRLVHGADDEMVLEALLEDLRSGLSLRVGPLTISHRETIARTVDIAFTASEGAPRRVATIRLAMARDAHAQRLIGDGQIAESWKRRIRERLGMIDMRLLTRILGDGLSFAECATLEGKSGDRGQRYVAARYRDALEDLAEAWTAKGKSVPTPADGYAAATETMGQRQRQSMADGATLQRLEDEHAILAAKRGKTRGGRARARRAGGADLGHLFR